MSDDLAEQRGDPEWKVIVQEGWAGLVESHRFVAQGNVVGFGSRKLIGTVKNALSRMDLSRRIQQQVLNRGMQILANHEACLGCDQDAIGWRSVPRQIDHPPWHHHLVDKRIERDKGVRTRVAGKRDTLVGKELLLGSRCAVRR